jgi:iron complex transport system substrate-binding protein
MRVVSLLPSATEIMYALGAQNALCGVTFECDEPARARLDHRVIVGGRDTRAMAPGDIDAYVRDQLAAGGDLYTLEQDALAGLDPDLVLTQDLCRVCAVPAGQVTQALDRLGCTAAVLTLDPHTLADVLHSIVAVGRATGVADRAEQLCAALQRRIDAVRGAVAGRARPRVAVVEWTDPLFAAGHWIPDLIEAAGGVAVAARPGQPSVPIAWSELFDAAPDVIVVAPCGYHLDGAHQQAAGILDRLPLAPVWAIDADGIIVRPGPRLVDGIEALATILHPDVAGAWPDHSASVREVRRS